jgi:tetratricopeptide (TPR) repeat protein
MQQPKKQNNLVFKIATVLIPFVLLFLLEVGLHISEYGGNQDLFIGMSGTYSAYKKCNPAVARRFFVREKSLPSPSTDIFLKQKPTNGYRIFVVGGSSAAGYPYGENVMFSRILNRWLSETFPDKNIEIVNTAMPAVNSYTLLDFMDEILENEPDAIFIYGGHNEFYGALGIGSSESIGKSPALVNLILKFQKYKTVQLAQNIVYGLLSVFKGDNAVYKNTTLMERMVKEQSIYYKSEIYQAGLNQFKSNLEKIIEKTKAAKIKILIGELVSNLHDQKPFISQKGMFNADSSFALARSFEKEGRFEKANKMYYLAKDYDMLRFRAPEEFNRIIHQSAKNELVSVVPLKKFFTNSSLNGLVGNNLFLEHLHPNFMGYKLMAEAFYTTMEQAGFIVPSWPEKKDSQDKKFGFTQLDSSLAALKIKILKGGWPFKKRSAVNTVINNYKPKNRIDSTALKVWKEKNYSLERGHVKLAQYFTKQKDYEAAFREYNALTQITPSNASPYLKAAEMLIKTNRYEMASDFLTESLKFENSFYANKWLGQILLSKKEIVKAIHYLETAVRKNNHDKQLLFNLGGAYFMNKQYSQSLSSLELLQKLSPNFPGLLKLRSHVQELAGQDRAR